MQQLPINQAHLVSLIRSAVWRVTRSLVLVSKNLCGGEKVKVSERTVQYHPIPSLSSGQHCVPAPLQGKNHQEEDAKSILDVLVLSSSKRLPVTFWEKNIQGAFGHPMPETLHSPCHRT